MARVYLALIAGPSDFNKLLVLKVLRDGALSDTEGAVQMFLNEARLAARLVHPNIVHTYEVGESAGHYFLAMEYIEGQTYRALTQHVGPKRLPVLEHVRILSELSRGLHYLHEQTDFDGQPLGAVHRDVSPQNVLLAYDGQVKLVDFGIAKTAYASHYTQVDAIKGKIDYIAPEQLLREKVDRRADVFSLGVLLYEALADRRFAGGAGVSDYAKAQARLEGAEPKLHAVAPDAPQSLVAIAERALELDPDARWPSAAAFGEALDAYVLESGALPATDKSLALQLSQRFDRERQSLRRVVELEIARARHGHYVELESDTTGHLPRLGTRESASLSRSFHTAPGMRTEPAAKHGMATVETASIPALASGQHGRGGSRGLRGLPLLDRLPPRARYVLLAGVAAAVCLAMVAPTQRAPSASRDTFAHSAGPIAPSTGAGATSATSSALRTGGGSPGAAREEPAALRAIATPLLPAPPDTIRAQVTVQPAHAEVRLDGLLLQLPFHGELPRDGTLHTVRATAPGHLPSRQLVGFDRDRTLDIVLQPAARARPSKPVSDADREQTAPLRDPATAQAELSRRADESRESSRELPVGSKRVSTGVSHGIDTEDPYAIRR